MLTRFEGQDLDTFDDPQQEAFIATVAAASGEGADVVITRISQASGTAVRHLRGRRRRSLQGAASAGSFTAEYQVQHVQGEAAAAAAGKELVRQSLTGQLLKEFQAAPGADGSTATRLDTSVVGITREQPPGAKRANVAAVVVSVLAGVLLVAAAAVCYARARARKLMMTEALPKSHTVSSSSVMTVSAVYELDPGTELPVQQQRQQAPLPPSKLTVNTELPRRPRAPLAEHCTTAEGTPITCTYPGASDPFQLSAAPARPQRQQQRGGSASPTRSGGSRRNIMRALGASGRSLGRQGSKRLSTAPSSRSFAWRPPAYRKTASVPDGGSSLSLRALMGGGGAAAAARRASWSSRQRSTRFGGKKAWLSDRDMGLQLQAERCGVAPPAHESMSTRARAAVAAANTFYPSNLNTPIKSVYDSGGGSEGDGGDEFDVDEGDTFHIEETGADRAARLGAAGMTPRYRPDFHHMFRANQPLDAKIYTAAATEERKPADWSTRNFPSGNGGGDENARTAALVRAAANKSACIAKYFQLCGQPSKNTRAIAQWAADVFASLDAVAEHMSVATPHSVPEVDGLAMERAHKTIKRLMNIVRQHRAQGTLAECAQQTETTELVAAAARQAVEAVINAPSVTQAELALLCAPQLDIIAETPQPTRAQMGFTHYRRYDIKSGHAI